MSKKKKDEPPGKFMKVLQENIAKVELGDEDEIIRIEPSKDFRYHI